MRDDDAVKDKNKKNRKLDEKKNTDTYAELSACCKKTFHAMSISGVVSSAAPEGDELELEWIHGTRQFNFPPHTYICTYTNFSSHFCFFSSILINFINLQS